MTKHVKKRIGQYLPCKLALVICCITSVVRAHVYMAPVDQATWDFEGSALRCTLWHPIPHYGEARFNQRAGETLEFWLQTKRKAVDLSEARLTSVPPEWKPDLASRDLGTAALTIGHRPMLLEAPKSSQVLAELQLGMVPSIQHGGWYPGHQVNVRVSSVNFMPAYRGYLDCIAGLFEANFDQLERTRVLFESAKSDIADSYKSRLALISRYLRVDPTVKRIVIDGHTDSVGRMGYNWDLSRNRADAVAAYLKHLGVREDQLLVRYHGEQFPVLDNQSSESRAQNRRVTLRLDRSED